MTLSRIRIHRDHDLSPEQIRNEAEHLVEALSKRYGLTYEWLNDELHFYRTGVTGRVVIEEKALAVEAKLGMMLAPLKSPISEEISRRLDDFLTA